jgi:transcriptional regulator with GAF, ATPase, and Fis domain
MAMSGHSRLGGTLADSPSARQLALAREISVRASARWQRRAPVVIVGRHPALATVLERLSMFGQADGPVLITGETGTGKELFARALHLLSPRTGGPFFAVNCAQYHDGQLIASELFGHRKGSFTGAFTEHRGVFEAAAGGTLFLDEVGELSLTAQAMLLRALSEGEIVPVGETKARSIDVRIVAATSRDMSTLVNTGQFRKDLYYRLRCLHMTLPPLRQRGDDWQLIVDEYLERLTTSRASRKVFSEDALRTLSRYHWPGNVREAKAIVETGFHLSTKETIEPADFLESLENLARCDQFAGADFNDPVDALYARLRDEQASFWDIVHHPFIDRELSRQQVRRLVARGLGDSRGSYKKLLRMLGIADSEYLRFMDFLRHHKLKPSDER